MIENVIEKPFKSYTKKVHEISSLTDRYLDHIFDHIFDRKVYSIGALIARTRSEENPISLWFRSRNFQNNIQHGHPVLLVSIAV